jgi:cytochrome c-type biogenesis protein CcmH
MILFWLLCALLIVIAVAFVLPPVLQRETKSQKSIAEERKLANVAIYRDQLSELEADLQNGLVSQEQYAQDRDEIERRLLEDTAGPPGALPSPVATRKKATAAVPAANRGTAYGVAFALSLIAVIFYLFVGNPDAITGTGRVETPAPAASTEGPTQSQIEARVTALANRLQANPNDLQGWTMLARSYTDMERFAEAAGAYAKATELQPNDADLWIDYAYVSAMANDKNLAGKPTELINQALKVDPENPKALGLAGNAAFQAKDYKKAIDYWQRVLDRFPPDSEGRQAIQNRINEAKKLAGNK